MIDIILATMWSEVNLALTLIFFVLIFNWANANFRNGILAFIFAGVIAYLTFYRHPSLVWIFLVFILASTGIFNQFVGGVLGAVQK